MSSRLAATALSVTSAARLSSWDTGGMQPLQEAMLPPPRQGGQREPPERKSPMEKSSVAMAAAIYR